MRSVTVLGAVLLSTTAALSNDCIETGFVRDGTNLTAKLVNPSSPVTGVVDATGCHIGVYVNTGSLEIQNATIKSATYFGVVNDGATVNVKFSTIEMIGESPFNGAQHGVAIYYCNGGSGTIDSNTVKQYQKGGIVVTGVGTKASVTRNIVTGLGPVNFIAQNGIQVSRGATGEVSGNDISGHYYTACSHQDAAQTGCTPWVAAGLLLYDIDPNAVRRSNNYFRGNQFNVLMLTSASLHSGL